MGLGPGFEPTYAVLATKKDVVKKLKEAAKKAKQIYLAPDPDREGEAIAWHIAEVLGDVDGEVHRVTFNEITKSAVLKALENKGKIDLNRVDAQQARRVIDRLMGFKLSPLLWDKLKRGLSAGRVQSVALKMVCERQAEIDAFNPEEYWIVGGRFAAQAPPEFAARLHQIDGKKARVGDGAQAAAIEKDLLAGTVQGRRHRAQGIEAAPLAPLHHQPPAAGGGAEVQLLGEAHDGHRAGPLRRQGDRRPRPDRSHHLHAYRFDARRGGGDRCRARDDRQRPTAPTSCRRSPTSMPRRRARRTPTRRSARPTSTCRPRQLAPYLEADELKLYRLIWERFVASQMLPAVFDVTQVDIANGIYTLRAAGKVMKSAGFLAVYQEAKEEAAERRAALKGDVEDEDDADGLLPALEEGETLKLVKLDKEQKFTQPPAQFSEATLVKALEENGIGRPSTYAAILSTLDDARLRREARRAASTRWRSARWSTACCSRASPTS